jgi:hypothetical protein
MAGTLMFATFACADPDAELEQEFRAASLALAAQYEAGSKGAVEGRDGWILHSREVNYLTAGTSVGDAAPQANEYSPPEYSDAVAVIVSFNSQLKKRGIEMYFVPVPERPVIYPESVLGPELFADRDVIPNLHSFLQDVLSVLQERGVMVIDLTQPFLSQREGPNGRAVYCRSETHWTPHGIALAAEILAAKIREKPRFDTIPKNNFHQRWIPRKHKVSVYKSFEAETGNVLEPDEVSIRRVRLETDEGSQRIKLNNPQSPVIVMGDSNTIFWSDLDSALPYHLAYELGFPIDVFANKGGGANEARLNLVRKTHSEPEFLDGKRVLIWCLSARAFTNPRQGWIPVEMD